MLRGATATPVHKIKIYPHLEACASIAVCMARHESVARTHERTMLKVDPRTSCAHAAAIAGDAAADDAGLRTRHGSRKPEPPTVHIVKVNTDY